MMVIRALFVVVIVALTGAANAQDSMQRSLPNFTKTSERTPPKVYHHDYGVKTLEADSTTLATYHNQNVAALLSQQYPVFIRTYGTNGLATLSLRGASAAQTAVRWNGVPLQSGATGLVDLMLVPVSMLDEVSIQYGSNGGAAGSGAIGGTLNLENNRLWGKQRLAVHAATGSFGRMIAGGNFNKVIHGRLAIAVAAIAQQANNNFRYEDRDNHEQRMAKGKFTSGTIQGSIGYRISSRNALVANVWADKNSREIPPALFETISVKEQKDAAIRSNISFTHQAESKQATSGITASFFNEWFRYTDSASSINTKLHTRQWFAEPSIEWQSNYRTFLKLSFPQQLNQVVAEPGKQVLKSAAVATLKHWIPGGSSLSMDARAESVNGKIYGAGGVNAATHLFKSFEVLGSAGYAYRVPTLNELYYTPGGNPNLLAEQGYSAEAGYRWYKKLSKNIGLTHSTTAFYRNIKNWILWFGGAVWTPHNIARVVSSGLETENKLTWKRPKIQWQLTANASFINSKTAESIIANDASVGKQIPYAPHIIGNGNLGFTTKRWRLNYNQTYMGIRYYNTDETGELQGFALGNVQAGWQYKTTFWTFDFGLQVQNIWNKRYAEVSGRPAPGTNFLLSLSVLRSK